MRAPHIELVCVGTELLTHRANTHAVLIGEALASIGFSLAREHTVGDDPREMESVFRDAHRRSDIVISTGGLGPTFDDITREVWSKVVKQRLVYHPALVDEIRQKFQSRGLAMPPHNRRQGYLLKKAEMIPNRNGTAPGQYLRIGKKTLILLPGPAREVNLMLSGFVIPRLRHSFSQQLTRRKSFHMVGVPESLIDELVRPLIKSFRRPAGIQIDFGILASNSIITVKFQMWGKDVVRLDKVFKELEKRFRKCLRPYLYGEDGDRLETVIGRILMKKKKTLAVAESCTGGLIAKYLTDISGASHYFKEGITTYSNQSKVQRLGVQAKTLKKWGAVSAQTAKEMARGLRKKGNVDYALSTTGIAGPTGGTPEKPVGLVYMACATPKKTIVKEFHLNGERDWIRNRSTILALSLLFKVLRTRE